MDYKKAGVDIEAGYTVGRIDERARKKDNAP